MEIKIKRVWGNKLDEYKKVLDKYNAIYKGEEDDCDYYAIIEIKDLNEIFTLGKELNQDLIINHYNKNENQLDIYDDYIE